MAGKEIVFKQRNALGLDILVKLIDGRELQVSNIGKKTNQTYSVDILSLQDKSKKIFSIAWKWLAASMSFLLVMLLLFKFLPTYL
ncbi:MAG: hypothetical protein OQK75_00345, partial [Gammaproteobacteria bacterium]|nr:hypothetical protein [Gammaproteobacteria bacterium]